MILNRTGSYTILLLLVIGLGITSYAQAAADKTTAAEINQQTQQLLQSLKAYSALHDAWENAEKEFSSDK